MGNGTSIGRVRGLGSGHNGTHHWLGIRYTSIASLVLTAWFGASLLFLPALDYVSVREWLVRPIPATAMALFVIVNIWHTVQGVQIIIEDYVHEPASKVTSLVTLRLVAFAGAAFGLFCIVRLALGGA